MYKDISDFYSPVCMLGKGGSSKVIYKEYSHRYI